MQTICTTKHISDHIVTALHKSNLGGTHPRAPTLEFRRFMQKTALRTWHPTSTRIAWTCSESWRLKSTIRTTPIESLAGKSGKPQTYGTQIARRDIQPNCTTIHCTEHIVAPQNKSHRGGTHPHDPKLECSRHVRINVCRVPSFWFFANMFAIMSAGQSTQMRTRIQQWHKSMNAITQTENHKHPKQISLDAACARFSPLTKVPNTSWRLDNLVAQIFTLQRWNAH